MIEDQQRLCTADGMARYLRAMSAAYVVQAADRRGLVPSRNVQAVIQHTFARDGLPWKIVSTWSFMQKSWVVEVLRTPAGSL